MKKKYLNKIIFATILLLSCSSRGVSGPFPKTNQSEAKTLLKEVVIERKKSDRFKRVILVKNPIEFYEILENKEFCKNIQFDFRLLDSLDLSNLDLRNISIIGWPKKMLNLTRSKLGTSPYNFSECDVVVFNEVDLSKTRIVGWPKAEVWLEYATLSNDYYLFENLNEVSFAGTDLSKKNVEIKKCNVVYFSENNFTRGVCKLINCNSIYINKKDFSCLKIEGILKNIYYLDYKFSGFNKNIDLKINNKVKNLKLQNFKFNSLNKGNIFRE